MRLIIFSLAETTVILALWLAVEFAARVIGGRRA